MVVPRPARASARRAGAEADGGVLDAGCGTGGLLAQLRHAAGRARRFGLGVESASARAGRAAAKSGAPVVRGSVNALPFADAQLRRRDRRRRAVPRARSIRRRRWPNCGACCARAAGWSSTCRPTPGCCRRTTGRSTMSAADTRAAARGRCWRRPASRACAPRYWNGLLLPLMVVQRKLLARGGGRLGRRRVSAMARCHVAWHDRARASPALPPAGRRIGAGDRGATMNDDVPLLPQPSRRCTAPCRTPDAWPAGVGLSIVVPGVSRRRDHRRAGRGAVGAARPPAGWRSCWSTTAAPTIPARSAASWCDRARVPLTYIEHARNFGEHNAVMTGLRHARGAYVITMDDDLQNPPEEVDPALRPCAARRLGRRLHALRRSSSTPAGAISAAASPTRSRIVCWTSRRGSICRRSAACRRWWCGR